MRLPIFQVDAFTDGLFGGNPAAVCLLDRWLPDALLQAIAAENNLSETGFCLPAADPIGLRWFTPRVEVNLCGHATLAAAHVLFQQRSPDLTRLTFETRSGLLAAERSADGIRLDFPALPPIPRNLDSAASRSLVAALGTPPKELWDSRNHVLAVYPSEGDVAGLEPDPRALAEAEPRGLIASARGTECDFVSRVFAPARGVIEDPVTGAAHCVLTPYWAERLGRDRLRARQISARGGTVLCHLRADRVQLTGKAVTYLEGEIRTETSD